MTARGPMLLALAACAGCGADTIDPTAGEPPPIVVHLAEAVDADGEGEVIVELAPPGTRTVVIHLDGEARIVELAVAGAEQAILATGDHELDGTPYDGGVWHPPAPHDDGVLTLEADAAARRVTVWARGAPVPEVRRERSLVWTDEAIVGDPSVVGLARVLAAASSDGHGGLLLDRWLRRFATTIHSERAGPAQLAAELATTHGADPRRWDLDALPFAVTAVHNRLDLAPRDEGCGELRVSFASTHPIYAPMHLLFLFRQAPRADDAAPDGTLHCTGTARRWSRLSSLDGASFVEAARAWLDEGLVHDRFLLAETVELTVSPWEWRQWVAVDDDVLDNPPLFQTVATPELNAPGPLRDAFLAFVDDNAAALHARELAIPEEFRAPSARVPPSAPAERLDLEGAGALEDHPDLAFRIEIVGCPTCHTHNANFVHTSADGTFSPFYERELVARGARLDAMGRGEPVPVPPFGPLQAL